MDRLKTKRGHIRRKEETLFSSMLKGGAFALVLMTVLAAVLSFFALVSADSGEIVFPLAVFCVFAGSAAGACLAAKLFPKSAFYAGLLSGCVPLVLMILVSVIFSKSFDGSVISSMVVPSALLLGCFLGALLGSRKRSNTKKMMKKLAGR